MCLLGRAGRAQDLTLSPPLQGSAPFLGAPSRGLWGLAERVSLLQPIKLPPRLVSVTVWDMPLTLSPPRALHFAKNISWEAGGILISHLLGLREATRLQVRWWPDQISALGSPHAPGPSHLPLRLA